MPADVSLQIRSRKRAFKPKTRTGCGICKKRRIKCDEQRPSCFHCTRSGWKCDGYPPTPPNKASPTKSETSTSSPELSSLSTSLSICIQGNSRERRSFIFFKARTIPQLIGSSPFLETTDEFWNTLLLQTAHHEPAVRHAVFALGALHEVFEVHGAHSPEENFAVSQYIHAISLLVEPGTKKGKTMNLDVALITCVLFVCFEVLRGHLGSALSHIDSGAKILREHFLQDTKRPADKDSFKALAVSPKPYAPLKILHLIFSRLDTQASQVVSGRPRRILDPYLTQPSNSYICSSPRSLQIPQRFASLHEARESFSDICTSAMHAAESLTGPDRTLIQLAPFGPDMQLSLSLITNSARMRLKLWDQAFRRIDLSQYDEDAVRVVKIHRTFAYICFGIDNSRLEDETQWDRFQPECESILNDAEAILKPGSTKNKRIFTLDTSLLFPLFFTAVKCRCPKVRRRAIALMKDEERQEGIWNSVLMARTAERMVEIEEFGVEVDGHVKRYNRIAGVDIKLGLGERKAELGFIVMGEGPFDGKGIQIAKETMEW